jgi:hypothetical protein
MSFVTLVVRRAANTVTKVKFPNVARRKQKMITHTVVVVSPKPPRQLPLETAKRTASNIKIRAQERVVRPPVQLRGVCSPAHPPAKSVNHRSLGMAVRRTNRRTHRVWLQDPLEADRLQLVHSRRSDAHAGSWLVPSALNGCKRRLQSPPPQHTHDLAPA